MIAKDDNPYVGPFPLSEGDGIFGRDWEIEEIADVVISERLALLYSPSGAGKTSLINAGLRPHLTKYRGFFVYPIVRLNQVPPEDTDPGAVNRYTWSTVCSLTNAGDEEEEGNPSLNETTIPEALAHFELENPRQRRLLIFDQFEELLTSDVANIEAKRKFLATVRALTVDPTLFVLIAMREEFVTLLEEFMPPVRLSGRFRLDFLSLSSAEDAIKKPAAKRGVSFSETLAHELALNLSTTKIDRPGLESGDFYGEVEPMQIQLVCRRIWRKRDPGKKSITKEDFPDPSLLTAAIDDALAEYYSGTIRDVCDETGTDEATLRRWLVTELITDDGMRDQVGLAKIGRSGIARDVIELLVDRHLIRSEKSGRRLFYELAHDRLVRPILTESDEWTKAHLQLFQRQTQNYSEGKSNELLSGGELKDALAWVKMNNYKMTDEEERFLEKSKYKQKKQFWFNVRVSAVVILLFLAALAWVYIQKDQAEYQAELAKRDAREKQAQIDILIEKEKTVKFSTDLEKTKLMAELSETRAQGAEKKLRLDYVDAKLREASFLAETNEFGAAIKALEAHQVTERPPRKRISAALLKWFASGFNQNSSRPFNYFDPIGNSLTSAVSSESNQWIFLSGKDGNAYLYDREGKTNVKLNADASKNRILHPSFLKEEGHLIAHDINGNFRTLKFERSSSGIEYEWIASEIKRDDDSVIFDFAQMPSIGKFVVIEESKKCIRSENFATASGGPERCWAIWLRDANSKNDHMIAYYDQELSDRLPEKLTFIEVTPSGRIFVAGSDMVCSVFDDANNHADARIAADSGRVNCISTSTPVTALAVNDQKVAVGTIDGMVYVWPVPKPMPGWLNNISIFRSGGAPIRALLFFKDDYLLSAGDDQQIRLSDVLSGDTQRVLEGHHAAVMDLVRISDQEVLSVAMNGEALIWEPRSFVGMRIIDFPATVTEYCDNPGSACANPGEVLHPYSVALSPDLMKLAIGFWEGGFGLYSIPESKLISLDNFKTGGDEKSELGRSRTNSIEFDRSGSYLGVGSVTEDASDGAATIYSLTNDDINPIASAEFKLRVSAVTFLPDSLNTTLVASSFDGRLATLSVDGSKQYFPEDPINTDIYQNRNYDRDLNSVATDCSGGFLVTTSNRAPKIWEIVDGKPVDKNLNFGESAQKIVWAELREPVGPLIDSGFSGLRRQFDLTDQPPQLKVMPGHYADVNRTAFGPYGTTIFSIDDRGTLRVRALEDERDLFGFRVPALTGIGEGKVNEVRDFALQCQYDIKKRVKKCMLAIPLADRPAVALYDLDMTLASDSLFPDYIEEGLPDSLRTCLEF